MPKRNKANKILDRWVAMDRALSIGDDGLHLPTFAAEWDVSEKTVRRDLAEFRRHGYKAWLLWEEGGRRWVWIYPPMAPPIFLRNVPHWRMWLKLKQERVRSGKEQPPKET
jgi:hypothetical protein